MKTLFYYYYLFYKWTKAETQPLLTAWFAFSFSENFILIGLMDLISSLVFKQRINFIIQLFFSGCLFLANYIFFITRGTAKKIIIDKPCFWGSPFYSKIITLIFFISSFVLLIILEKTGFRIRVN